MNKQKNQAGQSVLEILVAVGIFSIVASAISFLILDAYTANRSGGEISQATFFAQEGIEAVKSIRDNNWDDLDEGKHGLVQQGNNWRLQNQPDDLNAYLTNGLRSIIVKDVSADEKKITSQIKWDFSQGYPQNIALVTYLTNWHKQGPYCGGTARACDRFNEASCLDQQGCYLEGACEGNCRCRQQNETTCSIQMQTSNCYWWEGGPTCFDWVDGCDCVLFTDSSNCNIAPSCSWENTCQGEPTPCSSLNNQPDCDNQTGCRWVIP